MYEKRIPMEHLRNMRDLGGCPAADGRITKWNRLYRSNSPAWLTQEEWRALEDLNITLLIDLRSEQERKSHAITPGYPADYEAVSLMKDLDEMPADQAKTRQEDPDLAAKQILKSMELDYTKTLFGNLPGAVKILELILTNLKTDGSTMFFCSAGKDRTGITSALLLYLCGVPREDIIADYAITGIYNEKEVDHLISSVPKELAPYMPDDETLRKSMDSAPKTMADLLDAFEERDIRNALSENGFGEEKQKELAGLMTDPA